MSTGNGVGSCVVVSLVVTKGVVGLGVVAGDDVGVVVEVMNAVVVVDIIGSGVGQGSFVSITFPFLQIA